MIADAIEMMRWGIRATAAFALPLVMLDAEGRFYASMLGFLATTSTDTQLSCDGVRQG